VTSTTELPCPGCDEAEPAPTRATCVHCGRKLTLVQYGTYTVWGLARPGKKHPLECTQPCHEIERPKAA
jgi:hypothetical protein